MLLALRWEDYRVYMCITSHNSWCHSENIPRAISIDPAFPLWVPPSNLASHLPPTPSCSESIVESKQDVEPKESIRLDKDVGSDSVTDKDIRRFLPFPLVYLKFQLLFSQTKKMLMVY
jgi:hypothetical protein